MISESFSFLFIYSLTAVIFGLSFFYCFWSLISTNLLKIKFYDLSLFMTIGFFIAVITEPIHDFVYKYFTGDFLWQYQVFPIFGGASTGLAFLVWPLYGWHTYLLHQTMKNYGIVLPNWFRSIIPAIDGILFDIIANLASFFIFNIIFFYYSSDKLWHFSSFWVIPFYAISGIIYRYILDIFLNMPKNKIIPILFYCFGCLVILIGEILFNLN